MSMTKRLRLGRLLDNNMSINALASILLIGVFLAGYAATNRNWDAMNFSIFLIVAAALGIAFLFLQ
jgi:hypothetical protein